LLLSCLQDVEAQLAELQETHQALMAKHEEAEVQNQELQMLLFVVFFFQQISVIRCVLDVDCLLQDQLAHTTLPLPLSTNLTHE
jgi:hypothetical protein